ncbi:CS domain containing protein [Tritrichomonas foetus]|uniref:CS domain containing protein n=1 Tax=Tritrichomonas foetus TaxID=1144522 RepID=A0A1J4K8Z0_9EUKA|nr:CS domain containing protein [Tritrichomonas foetus]|eukprot:OHT06180.1 CS domain containing protein [Tritrichomonas foetus]
MSASLKKTSDEAIIGSMAMKNYHVAIVLLEQLQHEHMKFSKENQVRLVECLIHVGRYLDAFNYIREFSEKGNNLRSLTFLKGYAYYMTSEYYNARDIFNQEPDWARWAAKCKLMLDITSGKRKIIEIGEPAKIPNPDEINPNITQSGKKITFSFPVKNVPKDRVDVTLLPYSLDVTIKIDNSKIVKEYELAKSVSPQSLDIITNEESVEISFDKEVDEPWEKVVISPESLQDLNVSLESIITALDEIPNYSDQEASEMFEQSQRLVMGDSPKGQQL